MIQVASYLNHPGQLNAGLIALPPVLVVTRWNTWYYAVLYHGEHLDYYISLVDAEIENGSTQQLHKLSTILHGDKLNVLRSELEFLAVHFEQLIKVLQLLEARQFKATKIYNQIADLLAWLRNAGFPYATASHEQYSNKVGRVHRRSKAACNTFFHAVYIYDPKQLPLLLNIFSDYEPAIASLSAEAGEWQASNRRAA